MTNTKSIKAKVADNKRKIIFSIIISILICLCTYADNCIKHQLLGSFDLFSYIAPSLRNSSPFPHDVIVVNTENDLELIDIDKGNVAISDRAKLTKFLKIADSTRNYKYIFYDIYLQEVYNKTSSDDSLAAVLSRMPRLVMVKSQTFRGSTTSLQDSLQIATKTCYNDYGYTISNQAFSNYQFIQEEESSVALRMYRELGTEKDTIKQWGPLYFSHGCLCKGAPIIYLQENYCVENNEGKKRFTNVLLGADYLNKTNAEIIKKIDNKIILIGNFSTDVHSTYIGAVPGPMWCYAAYDYLSKGKHILKPFKIILIFLLYFLICLGIVSETCKKAITKIVKGKIGLFICTLLSSSLLLSIVSAVIYITSKTFLITFIPSLILSLVSMAYHSNLISLKNEK